jgi:hypothetical protein
MEDVRFHARAGVAIATALALSPMGGSAYGAGTTPEITGTYWATRYDAKLSIVGGGDLPLTAMGKESYAKNQAGLKSGEITDVARKFCVPDGVPRAMASPYPFEIIHDPADQITMIHELNHQIRVIFMDKPLPTYGEVVAFPYYNGHSVGHWEGDTLVVQTTGFNEKTFLDATGAPHTDMLVTTERIRKLNATQLEDVITIHDPDYYTRDFQVRFTYTLRDDVRLEDYVCGESHRDISGIPGVAEARRANAAAGR